MQRQPGDTPYDSLRAEHAKAKSDPEPLRPEQAYSPTVSWTSEGGIVPQQASANNYDKVAQTRLASQVRAEGQIVAARGSEALNPDLQKAVKASESSEVAKASVYADMDPMTRLANERADRMQGVSATDRQISAARSRGDADPKLSSLIEKSEAAEKRGENGLRPQRQPSRYQELDAVSRIANERADGLEAAQGISNLQESRGRSV